MGAYPRLPFRSGTLRRPAWRSQRASGSANPALCPRLTQNESTLDPPPAFSFSSEHELLGG